MKVKKILIYGSSHLTKEVCNLLCKYYDLVGHVPSTKPVIAAKMDLPVVNEDIDYDIKLSVQYNKKILNIENSFNVHTGLLPEWGGVDILYHTLRENYFEQGLTFHQINLI